jgi:hypothetical protein
MATLTFDKLAYVDRLQAAGVGEREARALAEGLDQALRKEVATKTDLAAVRTDLTTSGQSKSTFRPRSTMCCAGWSAWRSPRLALR